MSKVYFLTHTFFPEGGAAASRVSERLKYWTEVDVTVLTQTRGSELRGNWGENVRILRMSPFLSSNNLILRALSYLKFSLWVSFKLLFKLRKGDLVVASSPQFLTLPAGLVCAKFKSAYFIAEIADLWPDTLVSLGVLKPKSLIFKIWKKMEKKIYEKSDAIVALTPGIKADIASMSAPHVSSKIKTILNGFEEKVWTGVKAKDTGLEGKFIFSYFGKVGRAQNLKILIGAAETLKNDPRIQFLIAGEGAHYQEIEELASAKQLRNISFLGWIPKEQMQSYWSKTDCGLIFLKDKELFKGAVPSKLVECIGTETPVLLSAPDSDASRIVNKEKIGLTAKAENEKDLIEAILRMINNKEEYKFYKSNLSSCKSSYTRRKQALDFLKIIEGVRGC